MYHHDASSPSARKHASTYGPFLPITTRSYDLGHVAPISKMFDIAYRIGRSSIRSRFPFVYFAMLPVITMSFPPSQMQRRQASLTLRRLAASICMEDTMGRPVADFIS